MDTLYVFVLSILLSIIIVLQSVQIGKVVDAVLYHHKIDFTFVLFTIFVILISRSSVQMILKVTGNALSIKVKHELRAFLSKKKDDAGTVMNNIQQGIEGFIHSLVTICHKCIVLRLFLVRF